MARTARGVFRGAGAVFLCLFLSSTAKAKVIMPTASPTASPDRGVVAAGWMPFVRPPAATISPAHKMDTQECEAHRGLIAFSGHLFGEGSTACWNGCLTRITEDHHETTPGGASVLLGVLRYTGTTCGK